MISGCVRIFGWNTLCMYWSNKSLTWEWNMLSGGGFWLIIHKFMSSLSASSQRTRKYRSLLKDKFKTTRLAAIFLLCWLLDGDRLSLHINQRMNRVHEWFALCEWWRHPMENWVWRKREGVGGYTQKMRWVCYAKCGLPPPPSALQAPHQSIPVQKLNTVCTVWA